MHLKKRAAESLSGSKNMKNIKSLFLIFSFVIAFSFAVSAQNKTLISLDGEKIDIEAQKDKVVVLAFGASWLPLSKSQVDTMNKLAKKYAGKNVAFYFVATDSSNAKSKNYASDDDLKKFATKNKLTVATLRDSEGTITLKSYKIDQIPSFVVLNKNGVIATEPIGGIDPLNDVTIPISALIDKNL